MLDDIHVPCLQNDSSVPPLLGSAHRQFVDIQCRRSGYCQRERAVGDWSALAVLGSIDFVDVHLVLARESTLVGRGKRAILVVHDFCGEYLILIGDPDVNKPGVVRAPRLSEEMDVE